MKRILYSQVAAGELRRHSAVAKRIMAKVRAYAETGAGDVKDLVGRPGRRLRVGDFRVIFEETEAEIRVLKIGPRANVYD